MPEFFQSWVLWQKLILACGMVAAVLLGILKLIYAQWKLHQFTAIAERERQEQIMQRSMSQRTRRSRAQPADDEPFGIRAIESGIEVEGVWISRGNTPDPELVSGNLSAASSSPDRSPKTFGLDLEKQKSSKHRRAPSDGAATTQTSRRSSDQSLSAEKPATRGGYHDAPMYPLPTKPPRSMYPPSSYAKYGGNPYISRPFTPARTLEGLDAIHKASTSLHGDESTESSDSSRRSTNSTGHIEPISASAPSLLTPKARPRPRIQSTSDLELMNSHRVSQVAETGQFTPRGRRMGQSQSVDMGHAHRPDSQSDRRSYFESHSLPPPSSTTPSARSLTTLPPAIRRSSLPNVTPFTEFCARTSRPSSLRSSSRDSTHSTLPSTTRSQSPIDSASSSPIIPASDGAAAMKLPPLPPPIQRPSFEKRTSQVVRGHGSGFEILRPGSFAPRESPMERQRAAAPGVSLQNGEGSEEGRRRLRKVRRPSVESVAGGEGGRRMSRISLFA